MATSMTTATAISRGVRHTKAKIDLREDKLDLAETLTKLKKTTDIFEQKNLAHTAAIQAAKCDEITTIKSLTKQFPAILMNRETCGQMLVSAALRGSSTARKIITFLFHHSPYVRNNTTYIIDDKNIKRSGIIETIRTATERTFPSESKATIGLIGELTEEAASRPDIMPKQRKELLDIYNNIKTTTTKRDSTFS